MKNTPNFAKASLGTQKGFSTLLGLLLFIVLVGGGLYLYSEKTSKEMPEVNSASTTTQKETSACTMDAKECPDGTYVGRTGPNCEFVCPVNNKNNLWNGKYSYENKYTIFSLTIDGEEATVIDDGYQTEIRFNATTKELDDKLLVLFYSYGSEDMFKNGYKKGDLLFTISNDNGKYITTWGKFEGLSDNKTDEFKKVE